MPAFETMRGQRVVATPAALDTALAVLASSTRPFFSGGAVPNAAPDRPRTTAQDVVLPLRIAPDEVLVFGALGPPGLTIPGDEHAIVVDETGFSARWFTWTDYAQVVAPQVEWRLPAERPALGQGRVAGVPAKLWCTDDGVLVLVPTAYAHDLQERLA